jgi:hypothetical protein
MLLGSVVLFLAAILLFVGFLLSSPSSLATAQQQQQTAPPPPTPATPAPTTAPTCPNPPLELVSWWPAVGNAEDFLDNNDGILQNGASFGGNVGYQAFRLDGVDDFVEIPSMNVGDTFSIDFWVNPGRSAAYEHLISNHYTSSENFGALYLHNGNLEYWQNGAAWFQQVPGSQTIQPNTWTHIALTYDGSVTRVYANGSELSSVTTTGNEHSETFNNALRIGSSNPHESNYFMGLIDDIGLYNRVLSVSEIQTLSSGVDKCTAITATTTNGRTTTTTTPSPQPPPATTTTTSTTTTTTTTPPPPPIASVTLHPDSVPQFFECGETPDTGSPTLPGLDVQSSAYTAITDGDANTEILGRAIFDVTFSEPITNRPGPDLLVYEIGNDPEPFNVTLFSGDILTQSIQYTAVVASATGDTDDCGFVVNTAEIDLSDFGIGGEEGEQGDNEEIIAITGIRVDNLGAEGCCTGADISDVVIFSPTAAATSGGGEEEEEEVVAEVNGTYVNPNIGFQIDLPTGWKGTEINFLVNSVFAIPGESDFELLTQQQGAGGGGGAFQESPTLMTIVGIDQETFNMLESVVSQLSALGQGGRGGQAGAGGGQEEEEILPQGSSSSDLLGTIMTPFGDSTVSCTFSQPSFVVINGINAEERVGECIDEGRGGGAVVGEVGTNAPKIKSYTFATQDNSLIVLGFFSNSTTTYDQNLPLFEESVRTISISRPADIATSDIYNRYKELVEMQQQQQQLLLSNQTSGGGGM